MLVRQYQNAVFLPIMRVHQMHGVPRFPFLWGGSHHQRAFRRALDMRYAFLPHLYSLAHRLYTDAIPMARRASAHVGPFPRRCQRQQCQTMGTYLVGDSLLPADNDRIEGLSSNPNASTIAFPPGRWFPFNASSRLSAAVVGPQTKHFAPELDELVLYVQEGSILALNSERLQYTDEPHAGVLLVHVYGGANAVFELVEDDGASLGYQVGATKKTLFQWNDQRGELSWSVMGSTNLSSPLLFTHFKAVLFPEGSRTIPVRPLGQGGVATFGSGA